MPVKTQESSWRRTEHRVREKEALMNNPQQGRMVQFCKPLTTNAKHAHPELEGEEESSEGSTGDRGW